MVALLMSYPRSGNHMVRAFLEAASGQPTLGCRGNSLDTPIRDRFSAEKITPFEKSSEQPIAQKIHWISEELSLRRDGYLTERLCLVVRDPAKCVVSQLIRSTNDLRGIRRWKKVRKLRKPERMSGIVISELENWYVLIDHYLASDLPKLVIGFEDLLSQNGLSIVNDQLLPFFGARGRFDDVKRMMTVAEFGRESQLSDTKSIPDAVYESNQLASEIVRSAVDYEEIRGKLGLPHTDSIVPLHVD
ncbi:hypothetical protein SuNHUV7_32240 (plasmid) [Pseudoseohaeicola sp. NH-UV-7]|uniref:hypothetical protein n=1 Tax=Sulfitobacter sp. TBRI5 TaxID=2989732 RepID=UPI003A64AE8B